MSTSKKSSKPVSEKGLIAPVQNLIGSVKDFIKSKKIRDLKKVWDAINKIETLISPPRK